MRTPTGSFLALLWVLLAVATVTAAQDPSNDTLTCKAFPSTIDNVHLKVLVMEDPPCVFYDATKVGNEQFTGLYIEFFDYIVRTMGTNNSYTYERWTGSFNSAIDYLVAGNADLAVTDFTINKVRLQKVDFAVPLMPGGLAIITLQASEGYGALGFLQPFDTMTWVALVLTAVAFAVVTWLLDRFSPYGRQLSHGTDDERQLNPANSFLNSFSLLLGQGATSPVVPSWSTRIAMIGYYLFVLIVIATYTANLTATLTIQAQTSSVQSVQDLKSQRLVFATDANSANTVFFLNSTSPFYSSMAPYMRQYATKVEMVDALRKGDIQAIVGDQLPLQYLAKQQPCDLDVTASTFYTTFLGLPVKKNSPFLNPMNDAITTGEQSGTFDDLITYWSDSTNQCNAGQSAAALRIAPWQLAGLWYQMVIFVSIAICAFFAELLVNNRFRAKPDATRWRRFAKFCGDHTRTTQQNVKELVDQRGNMAFTTVFIEESEDNVAEKLKVTGGRSSRVFSKMSRDSTTASGPQIEMNVISSDNVTHKANIYPSSVVVSGHTDTSSDF